MKKVLVYAVVMAAIITLGSCASKKDLENCRAENKSLTEANQSSREQLAAANARISALMTQLSNCEGNSAALQTKLDQVQTYATAKGVDIVKLTDEIKQSNKYIKHLVACKAKSDSLNMILTNNLTRSLSNEDKKDVDVQVLKGVVYISLSDNMLYKSGSYEISPKADATLSKIAKIIKDYKDYDVLIEGNTDTDAIKVKNIRNNWDLSCLRASSVVQALQNKFNVDPKRLTAGGRGEYNPVAKNNTAANKAKNRRTQIIITPKLDQFLELIGQAPKD